MKKRLKQTIKKIHLFSIAKRFYYFSKNLERKSYNYYFPTAKILLYHRIATSNNDPYQLCVSPENFRKQIKHLKENFRVIPLVQLVQEIKAKKIKNNSVVITFDDGYIDNLDNALPILEEFKIPATIFLTAGHIVKNEPFFWDEGIDAGDRGRPMAPEEVKGLSMSNLIEIGSHTINHPKLSKLDQSEQFEEVLGGKQIIEKIIDIPLLSFAYPFGDKKSFNKKTVELVKKAGFRYACANIHERVKNGSNIYSLPRFVIRNWGTEEFKKEFNKFI